VYESFVDESSTIERKKSKKISDKIMGRSSLS
jgi:hypothetical protein